MTANSAIIGVGSNINPRASIQCGEELLGKVVTIVQKTELLTTDPIGCKPGQPPFLNGGYLVQTPFAQPQLKSELKKIEQACGRKPDADPYAPRTLDLDIFVFNERIVDEDYYSRWYVRKIVHLLGFTEEKEVWK